MMSPSTAKPLDAILTKAVSKSIKINRLQVSNQPPVPKLAHKLERVLFSPGVHVLKDARTNVYNFDPKIEKIMSISEFDFTKIAPFVRADYDTKLFKLAKSVKAKFLGSTSSLTPFLMQFHLALSNFKQPQIMALSKYFPGELTTFTSTQKAPVSGRMKFNQEHGIHSIVGFGSTEMILSLLGHNLEAMLTTSSQEFERFRKTLKPDLKTPVSEDSVTDDNEAIKAANNAVKEDAENAVKEDVKEMTNTYSYSQIGSMLMRSQLDCQDPRLPGTGTFDLKTRACCAVRYDIDYAQVNNGSDYQIKKLHGEYESYAREYFELIRSAMFKYSLQARIGNMDGIFIAYHNVRKMFGFQYVPLTEIDKIYHTAQLIIDRKKTDQGKKEANASKKSWDIDLEARLAETASYTADAEFKLSVTLFNRLLEKMLKLYDGYKHITFVLHADGPSSMLVFVDKDLEDSEFGILHPEYKPIDLKAFRLNFNQSINDTHLSQSQYPGIQSPNDVWSVTAISEDLTANAEELVCQTRARIVSQQLTSTPQKEHVSPEEIVAMLEQLPNATHYQKILRRLGELGSEYQEWDNKREKHVYK